MQTIRMSRVTASVFIFFLFFREMCQRFYHVINKKKNFYRKTNHLVFFSSNNSLIDLYTGIRCDYT